jgi:hypothetical protein
MRRPCCGDVLHRPPPDWERRLFTIAERVEQAGKGDAVLAFDLDSTALDNRPRQAKIVRDFGREQGLPELTACRTEHFESGFDLRSAVRNCGLPSAEVERLWGGLRAFWLQKFFTSEYCVEDVEVPGAARYLRRLFEKGARLCYVTGRPEGMREGTLHSLRAWEMPHPDEGALLWMKPDNAMSDEGFKREVQPKLRALGTVVAAFDNEPMHANGYRVGFPEANVVLVATDHSPARVRLLEGILPIPHFDLPEGPGRS